MLDAALAAHKAGLCVLPPKADGSKRPLVDWRDYTRQRSTVDEIYKWYERDKHEGLGVVLGKVSDNAEMLEFDNADAYSQYKILASGSGEGELVNRIENGYLEESPNGIHWFYKCDEIEGNKKLAQRPKTTAERQHPNDKVASLIETRGEGGFAIVAPSHGNTHPTGLPYKLLRGGFATIQRITPAERQALFGLAILLDEMPRKSDRAEVSLVNKAEAGDAERPGDWFNRVHYWADLLQIRGWVYAFDQGGEVYWRRPGKDRGISATTNYKDSDLLKVFSTSTEFDTATTYSKFAAFAVLEHGGDFGKAASAIRAMMPKAEKPDLGLIQGGGEVSEIPREDGDAERHIRVVRPSQTLQELLDEPEPEYDWLVEGLFERTDRLILTGPEGGGKSTFMRQMAVQLASGIHPFSLEDTEPIRVLYVDLENSRRHVRREFRPMRVEAHKRFRADGLYIEVMAQGLDLLADEDREWLDERLEVVKPDLLMIGPLYKLAAGDPTEEKVAKVVSNTLDHLRIKHDTAVVIEAHQPYGTTGKRPERPYGASLWSRWPEFGLHLASEGHLRHWRGARDERAWPALMARGGDWPWSAVTDGKRFTFAGILAAISETGRPMVERELAAYLKTPKSTIHDAITANKKQYDEACRGVRNEEF